MENADLSNAHLAEANCTNADFSGADLSGASLQDAVIEGAQMTGVKLEDAVLDGLDADALAANTEIVRDFLEVPGDLRQEIDLHENG